MHDRSQKTFTQQPTDSNRNCRSQHRQGNVRWTTPTRVQRGTKEMFGAANRCCPESYIQFESRDAQKRLEHAATMFHHSVCRTYTPILPSSLQVGQKTKSKLPHRLPLHVTCHLFPHTQLSCDRTKTRSKASTKTKTNRHC